MGYDCGHSAQEPTADLEATLFLQTTVEYFKIGDKTQVKF